MTTAVPTFDTYLWPIIERLKVHGGAMTNQEMADDVATAMGLSDEQQSAPHGQSGQSEVEYRMAWARTYLKKVGLLENSERGVWRLTARVADVSAADIGAVPRMVREAAKRTRAPMIAPAMAHPGVEETDPTATLSWIDALTERLLAMPPDGFERLCQRILREKGFTKVEVTGRSSDGGIDGTGVLRVNLLSFHVLFQSKRWRAPVGAPVVRDFRGAMVGRADKGLIITTASFTADARREAVRDGAPAIDLIDGEALAQLLKELRIGVTVRMVEEIGLDLDAFNEF